MFEYNVVVSLIIKPDPLLHMVVQVCMLWSLTAGTMN